MRIIIWGYKSPDHTMHWVHYGWFKAASYMGYEVYWFDDANRPPSDFCFNNSIIITEGCADKFLPTDDTSIYYVHTLINPAKYLNRCKRLIDLRYNHIWHKDHCYEYTLDKNRSIKLDKCMYYEPPSSNYEKIYVTWATDLLPHEIKTSWADEIYQRSIERIPSKMYFFGTISSQGRCENTSKWAPFIKEAESHGLQIYLFNPWIEPSPPEKVLRLVQGSTIAPDIRGPEHLKNGYIPCRIFKNMSYGHLGVTNSPEVYKELDGFCMLEQDTAKLFHVAMENRYNIDFIKAGMEYIREHHTYIHRLKALLSII